jgi:hypothetical protein
MIIKEFNIDLENKKIANGYVEDKEALKIWIHFALRTERYKYLIYSWNYGNEINNIIGKKTTKELFFSEVKRYIEECLVVNENITGIKDLKINRDGSKLNIEFTCMSIFGEVDINENL